MPSLNHIRSILMSLFLIALSSAGVAVGNVYALDTNSNGVAAGQDKSMDDVARMIRETRRWQILEARSRKKGSVMRYRFKLISNSGQVKIISIDPKRPNLRTLEQ